MNLINYLKRKIANYILNKFGFYLLKKRHKDYGFNNLIKKLITSNSPLIFDIGADCGQSIERYTSLFKDTNIHAFEPRFNQYQIIKKKFDENKNIYINNFAVGSEKENKIFYEIKGTGRSSFLKSNVDDSSKQEKIDVKVISIDDYVIENNIKKINLLKIDVQGYEDEVLKGAKETLRLNKIDIIETELIVGNLYEKSLSFNEIENLIYPFGYKFFALNNAMNLDRNSDNLFARPNLQFDLIYLSKEFQKKINN